MRLSWSVLLCSACPYLWGPPEYVSPGSSPDTNDVDTDSDSDSDVDSDADLDTDTDGDTDTDTGTVLDPDPVITSFTATLRFDVVELRFVVADADGDLDGASVSLGIDGARSDYTVDGLESWDGEVGTQGFPETVSCDGFAHDYTIVLTDSAGHPSAEVATSIVVVPRTIEEGGEPVALGTVALPAVFCSSHENQNDVDDWELDVDPGGDWSVAITHPSGPDRDVAVTDTSGAVLARSEDLAVPDSFSFPFVAGTVYRLHTEQEEGGSGDRYTVVISQ